MLPGFADFDRPFALLDVIRRRMDRVEDAMDTNKNLARHSGNAIEPVSQRPTITPAVDVYENDDELLLVADVPGASPDGIDVQLDKGQLTLQAG